MWLSTPVLLSPPHYCFLLMGKKRQKSLLYSAYVNFIIFIVSEEKGSPTLSNTDVSCKQEKYCMLATSLHLKRRKVVAVTVPVVENKSFLFCISTNNEN